MENTAEAVEQITETIVTAIESPNKLWKKSGEKGKRIPFKEFLKDYKKLNENFKNLKATDQTIQDASFNKGEGQFESQVAMTKTSGDTFYTLNTMQSDIMLPVNKGSEITDKGTMISMGVEDPATTDAPVPPNMPEGDNALLLFFLFGSMVGIASFIIFKKYSK